MIKYIKMSSSDIDSKDSNEQEQYYTELQFGVKRLEKYEKA